MTKKTRELKAVREDRFSEIFGQTVEDTQNIGTYKNEFSPIITRYTEMRVQFEILMSEWYNSGCKITEPYTNKNGATNNRKTALYQSVETLRAELTNLENLFGLTPAGLKKINEKSMAVQKESLLGKALNKLE